TANTDGKARLWRLTSDEPVELFTLSHDAPVWAAALSPKGKKALTGSLDRTARIWDVDTGKLIGLPLLHSDGVRAVAFSPDGNFALTAGFDNTVRIWEVATGRRQGSPLHLRKTARALAFDPESKTVVICDDGDRTAKRWVVITDSTDKIRFENPPAVRNPTL